jgi:outer membrane protein
MSRRPALKTPAAHLLSVSAQLQAFLWGPIPQAILAGLAVPALLQAQVAMLAPITLGGAARMAAERGSQTAVARARSSQADARVAQRRSLLMPSLTATSQYSAKSFNSAALGIELPAGGSAQMFDPRGEVLGPVRSTDFRTQVTQRLVDLPAMFNWRAATADAYAARFGVTSASEQAAERGATTYLSVVRAEARISARTADSALASELLDIARQQLTAGVGIALDVTRAEARLADARARLISTRADRDLAMLQLRHELTIAAEVPISIADSLEAPAPGGQDQSEDDVIRGALARRADFRETQASTASASAQARAARAERLPTVSLFADQGRNGKDLDRMLGTYSYGISISVPLFDGLRASSRAAEQDAKRREAEARLAETKRQIETDVRSALVTLSSTREEVTAARASLTLAEQEVSQARELFRAGVSGSSDVINASIGLNSARDLEIDALARYQLARVALASAQGITTSLR